MSQSAIGKAALVLTTNAADLRSGLNKEAGFVGQWATQLGRDIGKKAGGVQGFGSAISASLAGLVGVSGGLFGAAGTAIGAAIGGPAGAAIGGAIGAGIGALAGWALGSIGKLGQEIGGMFADTLSQALGTLGDLSKQGEVAGALGLTAEAFTGIAGVAKSAGEDTREFVESLVTMGNLGRDAAAGTEVASKAFKDMGLNADEFNKLRADEQFFAMFDALHKMGEGGARTNAIMKAFGEDGGKWLLPLLNKSPEKLREMAAGFAVSGEEMQRAQATTAAWGRLGTVADSLWRKFSVSIAEPLELIATGAEAVLGHVQPVFDWMRRTIGPLWDAGREGAELLWEGLKSLVIPAVAELTAWFERAFREVFQGVSTEWPSARDLMLSTFRAVGTAAAFAWDAMRPGAAVFVYIAGAAIEAFGAIVHAFRETIKDMAALGVALGRSIGNLELAKAFYSVYEQADQFGLRIAKIGDHVKDIGYSLSKQTFGGSAAQFNSWLDKMLNRTKATANEVKKTAATVAEASLKKFDNAALLKGSSAEVSARLKYELGAKGIQDKMLDAQQKGNGLLGGILGAAKEIAGRAAGVELMPL